MVFAATDTSWSLGPGPIAICILLAALYGRRWVVVRRAAGARGAPIARLLCFAGGVAALVAALISPIDTLAEQIFAMHMVQHVLLLDIAPILLIVGLTKMILRPATPHLHRLERGLGVFASPVAAVVLYVGLMWLWHVPALYDLALEHAGVHVLEHVTFMSVGALYWWHVLSPVRTRLRFGGLAPVGYMTVTKVLVGALGIVLTFAPNAIYDFYESGGRHWGLSATDDQALAGAIMAVEQSIVMGVALAYLFIRALSESEAAERRSERYADPDEPWVGADDARAPVAGPSGLDAD